MKYGVGIRRPYLNLQDIVTIKTLVMHFVICIICIASALILNKSEPASSVNYIRVDFKMAWDALTDDWPRFAVLECHNGQGDHSCRACVRFLCSNRRVRI